MDWEIQTTNGDWLELKELPVASDSYMKAILTVDTVEAVCLYPVNGHWVACVEGHREQV